MKAKPLIPQEETRPNILLCIADDQSWIHTGRAGCAAVRTPNFDRIAREGVYFPRAFCAAPTCTASRAGLLTGQAFCRLQESANLWSTLRASIPTYPDLLEKAGYAVGHWRKAWGPGNVNAGGRTRNPAGPTFPNLPAFLETVKPAQPFCFWLGTSDPHRPYVAGFSKDIARDKIEVPPYFPDTGIVRDDIADYLAEIERWDRELGEAFALLEQKGLWDNTLIVITSDNGMPFPRCKANCYDYGARMPLAIRWPKRIPGGREITDLVSSTDLAPTFLEAAGLRPGAEMTGRSLLPLLTGGKQGRVERSRNQVFYGRERHADVRANHESYPVRALRTEDFLYLRNFFPERWPAGDAPNFGDIDGGPTKNYLLDNRHRSTVRQLAARATDKRPAEELYDVVRDPYQLQNVAERPEYAATRRRLAEELAQIMRGLKDPRATNPTTPYFDQLPYYGNRNDAILQRGS
jgi:N-sulfoglucosamine sulfohydrolase